MAARRGGIRRSVPGRPGSPRPSGGGEASGARRGDRGYLEPGRGLLGVRRRELVAASGAGRPRVHRSGRPDRARRHGHGRRICCRRSRHARHRCAGGDSLDVVRRQRLGPPAAERPDDTVGAPGQLGRHHGQCCGRSRAGGGGRWPFHPGMGFGGRSTVDAGEPPSIACRGSRRGRPAGDRRIPGRARYRRYPTPAPLAARWRYVDRGRRQCLRINHRLAVAAGDRNSGPHTPRPRR